MLALPRAGVPVAGGIRVLDDELLRYLRIAMEVIETIAEKEKKELERRERVRRGDRALYPGDAMLTRVLSSR